MRVGAAVVKKFELLDKVNKGADELRIAFPSLVIGTVINSPYTHVTLRAESKVNLASIDSMAVLENSLDELKQIELEDLIEEFPSDHLVAQLALIA